MEGPSLVIACEEFAPYVGKKIIQSAGQARLDFKEITGKKLKGVRSWGKHFLLLFDGFMLRIHFLMFGSYRINNPRAQRDPKLVLTFPNGDQIYFYSCAIKRLQDNPEEIYDWSTDIMSSKWRPQKAFQKIQSKPQEMVCDVLMDQNIFSGIGNIIKNEVLYNLRMHPEIKIGDLTTDEIRSLVKEARTYSLQFYRWKKRGELKRHWQIFRKKDCPFNHEHLVKRKTGKGERVSFYCETCQPLKPPLVRSLKGPKIRPGSRRTLKQRPPTDAVKINQMDSR